MWYNMKDIFKKFKYIIAVSEKQNITEAAEYLGIAQPALSRFILNLEHDLGTELFNRASTPIELTEAGRYYVAAGKDILNRNRQLEKQLDILGKHKNLKLRIGSGPSRSSVLIPVILAEFKKTCPDTDIIIDEYRAAELSERLNEGRLDLVITFLDQHMENFCMEALFDENVSLAVPLNYTQQAESIMESSGAIDISRLSIPFISLHEGQQLRTALKILSHGTVNPCYVCDQLGTAMALAGHGFGAALVPSYWQISYKTPDIKYYPISVPDDLPESDHIALNAIINRHMGIFYRKEQFLSDAEKAFIAAAKEVFGKDN